ncbi:MAG: hypothetical protein IT381_26425 [Deltaproteobacteria bacterium]|nr:hypothetical protein [Deltaproteobacteria bacterium]
MWVAVSLGLHAILFLWLAQAPEQAKKARAPIEMTLLKPKPAAPPPIIVPTKKPAVHKPKAPVAVAQADPKDTEEPEQATEPSAPVADAQPRATPAQPPPRAIIKLGDGALLGLAGPSPRGADNYLPGHEPKPSKEEEIADANRVIKSSMEGFMVAQDTKTGARGTTIALRKALREKFTPASTLVAAIPGSGKASLQILKNMSDAYKRPQSTDGTAHGLVPSQQAMQAGMALSDPCAQSHEIGRLEARFRVEHDTSGQAQEWSLQLSSGDDAFDTYARDVIKTATQVELKAHPDEAIPLYSVWLLSQVVYDWASTPTCPPVSRPPGLPVFADRKQPYAITYTSEVALVTVRYRH